MLHYTRTHCTTLFAHAFIEFCKLVKAFENDELPNVALVIQQIMGGVGIRIQVQTFTRPLDILRQVC